MLLRNSEPIHTCIHAFYMRVYQIGLGRVPQFAQSRERQQHQAATTPKTKAEPEQTMQTSQTFSQSDSIWPSMPDDRLLMSLVGRCFACASYSTERRRFLGRISHNARMLYIPSCRRLCDGSDCLTSNLMVIAFWLAASINSKFSKALPRELSDFREHPFWIHTWESSLQELQLSIAESQVLAVTTTMQTTQIKHAQSDRHTDTHAHTHTQTQLKHRLTRHRQKDTQRQTHHYHSTEKATKC